MYVGTLTADEMSFAGAYSSKNENYYLINNYAKDNVDDWWSLSPYYYEDGYDFWDTAFYLANDGRLGNYVIDTEYVNYDYSSRPAVTLKSGSVITEGDGTIEKPYIITE